MTLVSIDLSDVASETRRDDRVVFWAPNLRAGTHTALVSVVLVAGVGSVSLKPGPVMVQVQCRGVADMAPRLGTVPEAGPVTLDEVLADTWDYTPEVLGAAAAARDAAVAAAASAWEAVDTPGRQGPKGDPGEDGLQGVDGAPGVQGPPGEMPPADRVLVNDAIAAGVVATAARDDVLDVVDSTVWDGDRLTVLGVQSPPLTGPEGPRGLQGDPGVDGVDGQVTFEALTPEQVEQITGPRGLQGEPGVQGEQGPPGVQGAPGEVTGVTWGSLTGKPEFFNPAAHSHPAAEISDSTAVGRSVVTAASAAAARTAIGAGTSSLALGSTGSTAAAGNHTHTPASLGAALAVHEHTVAQLSDGGAVGRSVVQASTAVAARAVLGAGTSSLVLGSTASTAAAGDHTHTLTALGAAPSHVEVTGSWPASGVAGTLYWKAE